MKARWGFAERSIKVREAKDELVKNIYRVSHFSIAVPTSIGNK